MKPLKAIYGLHQAPVKFKKEVEVWFKENGYTQVNDSATIWQLKTDKGILIHAVYVDDFLHFTDNKHMYNAFQQKFKKRFDIKSGSVGVYLGNTIHVEECHPQSYRLY